ncbi:MAG: sortase [Lachnospiraceae bacterium]|nr:sortase [Lachnospiraceae bacterium]
MLLGVLLVIAAAALVFYNRRQDEQAGEEVALILTQLEEATSETQLESPDTTMPVISIDGRDYIGTLRAEGVGIDLPIIAMYEEEDCWTAPCRYSGSAYNDTMVICGHNMYAHFAPLLQMQAGDEVTFTDVNGNVFRYEVAQIYNLKPVAVQEMITGDWDLTLFTCTYSGAERVTVRCLRVD